MTFRVLGIDFGTSTTVAAAATAAGEGPVVVLEDQRGRRVFPSVVAYPPAGGYLVGEEAKYRRPIDATNTLFSVKRIIGQPWTAGMVKKFLAKYPFELEEAGDGFPLFVTRAGRLTAVQVVATLIEHVLQIADMRNVQPEHVVVGVPTDFASHQRAAVVEAIKLAGLPGAVCVDEPLAIARAYLREDLGTRRRVVVYDLGGGTLDLAVCDISGGNCVVLASGGDEYLGGDDVDQLCADWVSERVLREIGWDIRTSPQAVGRLVAECERAKITLSKMIVTRIKLGAIEHNDTLAGRELQIERRLIEELTVDLVRRSFGLCDEVLARSGLQVNQIDDVLLAGGATLIPSVQAAVEGYFGKKPKVADAPDHLVAVGAAHIAQELLTPLHPPSLPAVGERRGAPRRKTSLRVAVRLPGSEKFQIVPASDMSKGGMFVGFDDVPPLNTAVELRFELGGGMAMEVPARVVYAISAQEAAKREGLLPGMGLEFGPLDASARGRIEELLTAAEQLFASATPRA